MENCPFCKILSTPDHPQIIEKGTYVTAIFKPYKSKNVNILIVSNDHLVNHKESTEEQSNNVMNETIQMSKRLFHDIDWSIKNNNGANADQTVFHMHTHVYSMVNWPSDKKWNFSRETVMKTSTRPYSKFKDRKAF